MKPRSLLTARRAAWLIFCNFLSSFPYDPTIDADAVLKIQPFFDKDRHINHVSYLLHVYLISTCGVPSKVNGSPNVLNPSFS
jgi:hypothetical protein